MQRLNGSPGRRRSPTPLNRRAELLAAFEQSGLSVAAFARQHRIVYTTFCGWRQRKAQAKPAPAFVHVELSAPPKPVELVIELGGQPTKRLEKGTFHWPQSAGEPNAKLRLAPHALQLLLDGVDLKDGGRRAWHEGSS